METFQGPGGGGNQILPNTNYPKNQNGKAIQHIYRGFFKCKFFKGPFRNISGEWKLLEGEEGPDFDFTRGEIPRF